MKTKVIFHVTLAYEDDKDNSDVIECTLEMVEMEFSMLLLLLYWIELTLTPVKKSYVWHHSQTLNLVSELFENEEAIDKVIVAEVFAIEPGLELSGGDKLLFVLVL